MPSDNEHNDCTVRCLSHAMGVRYSVAHAVMSKLGRKDRGRYPFDFEVLELALSLKGLKPVRMPLKKWEFAYFRHPCTRFTVNHLELFLRAMDNESTYVVYTSGHVLTIRTGVAMDGTSGRRHRVKRLYKVVDM